MASPLRAAARPVSRGFQSGMASCESEDERHRDETGFNGREKIALEGSRESGEGERCLSPSRAMLARRICLVAVIIDYIGVGMIRTCLPFYALKMGASATTVGALESCYGPFLDAAPRCAILRTARTECQVPGAKCREEKLTHRNVLAGAGQVVGAAVMGRVSDRYGRKVVLLLSFLGSALGYGMVGLATTTTHLLISRVPVGLAKQTVAVCTPPR